MAAQSALGQSLPAPAQMQNDIDSLVAEAVQDVTDMDQLKTELTQYLAENTKGDEEWSVAVTIPDSGAGFSLSDGEEKTAASTIKLFVVAAAMEKWDDLKKIGEDQLEHLMASCLIISDNDAATTLVSLLGDGDTTRGKQVVNDFCKAHGFNHTYLGILFTGLDPTGTYNATTVEDTVAFMTDLVNCELEGSGMMVDWMLQSERKSKIPAALPADVQTANKTGELIGIDNDVSIVYGPDRTYILAVMSDGASSEKAIDMIHRISKMTYERLNEND